MTREECKQLLVKKIIETGGIRFDELAAGYGMYATAGFSEVFHPDILRQLIAENRIGEIECTVPDKPLPISYLVPKGTQLAIRNISVSGSL